MRRVEIQKVVDSGKFAGHSITRWKVGIFWKPLCFAPTCGVRVGIAAIFAILKKEHERRRIVVAVFLSDLTKRAGFQYDFKFLEARLEQVVEDYLLHDLAGAYFELWVIPD